MTIYEFARQTWENCIDPEELVRDGYSIEVAALDLENFRVAGWDMPDDITPEEFAAAMNEVIAESREGDENAF